MQQCKQIEQKLQTFLQTCDGFPTYNWAVVEGNSHGTATERSDNQQQHLRLHIGTVRYVCTDIVHSRGVLDFHAAAADKWTRDMLSPSHS